MDYPALPFIVEPMRVEDIEEVMEIEHEAFSAPWTASAYRHELQKNEMAHYFVLRQRYASAPAPSELSAPKAKRHLWQALFPQSQRQERATSLALPLILGYGGFWLMAGEAHISTIATRREWRGRGLGELLLVAMIEEARALQADFVTLEVRVGNRIAQSLYHKYGFKVEGRRKRYYSDNGEDALIMTTPPIQNEAYCQSFGALKAKLWERLCKAE